MVKRSAGPFPIEDWRGIEHGVRDGDLAGGQTLAATLTFSVSGKEAADINLLTEDGRLVNVMIEMDRGMPCVRIYPPVAFCPGEPALTADEPLVIAKFGVNHGTVSIEAANTAIHATYNIDTEDLHSGDGVDEAIAAQCILCEQVKDLPNSAISERVHGIMGRLFLIKQIQQGSSASIVPDMSDVCLADAKAATSLYLEWALRKNLNEPDFKPIFDEAEVPSLYVWAVCQNHPYSHRVNCLSPADSG